MHYSTAILAVAAGFASYTSAAPEGCDPDYPGYFYIQDNSLAPSRVKRDVGCPADDTNKVGAFFIRLNNSDLTDEANRIGNIVANEQFQFDPKPGQAGYLQNSGFSVCANGSLAHGESTIFYSCNSGNFNNVYATSIASYCKPITVNVEKCDPTSQQLAIASSIAASEIGISGAPTSTSSAASSEAASSSSAASTPSSAPAVTSSTAATTAAASTGTGSPVYPGTNGTVSTGSPSSTSTPKAFTGAATSLAVGPALALLALGFAGFAVL